MEESLLVEMNKLHMCIVDSKSSSGECVFLRADVKNIIDANNWLNKYSALTDTRWVPSPKRIGFQKGWLCEYGRRNDGEGKIKCTASVDIIIKKLNKATKKSDHYLRQSYPLRAVIRLRPRHRHQSVDSHDAVNGRGDMHSAAAKDIKVENLDPAVLRIQSAYNIPGDQWNDDKDSPSTVQSNSDKAKECPNKFPELQSQLDLTFDINGTRSSFMCTTCGQTFADLTTCTIHSLTHVLTTGPLSMTQYPLLAPLQAQCGEEPQICEFCRRKFPNMNTKRKHLHLMHAAKQLKNPPHSSSNYLPQPKFVFTAANDEGLSVKDNTVFVGGDSIEAAADKDDTDPIPTMMVEPVPHAVEERSAAEEQSPSSTKCMRSMVLSKKPKNGPLPEVDFPPLMKKRYPLLAPLDIPQGEEAQICRLCSRKFPDLNTKKAHFLLAHPDAPEEQLVENNNRVELTCEEIRKAVNGTEIMKVVNGNVIRLCVKQRHQKAAIERKQELLATQNCKIGFVKAEAADHDLPQIQSSYNIPIEQWNNCNTDNDAKESCNDNPKLLGGPSIFQIEGGPSLVQIDANLTLVKNEIPWNLNLATSTGMESWSSFSHQTPSEITTINGLATGTLNAEQYPLLTTALQLQVGPELGLHIAKVDTQSECTVKIEPLPNNCCNQLARTNSRPVGGDCFEIDDRLKKEFFNDEQNQIGDRALRKWRPYHMHLKATAAGKMKRQPLGMAIECSVLDDPQSQHGKNNRQSIHRVVTGLLETNKMQNLDAKISTVPNKIFQPTRVIVRKKPYVCIICKEVCSGSKDFAAHMMKHGQEDKEKKKKKLNRAKLEEINSLKRIHRLAKCNAKALVFFTDARSAVPPSPTRIDSCKISPPPLPDWDVIEPAVHETSSSFVCKVCDQVFEKASALAAHNMKHMVERIHTTKRTCT